MAERTTLFADVILPLSVANYFTYRVPFELNRQVDPGKRVIVPFGKSKFYTAIVARVHEEVPKNYQAKYIEAVLDENPIVTGHQFKLWKWISEYYMAPIGDVMNAAVPANFKLASETKISLHPDAIGQHHYDTLDEKEQLVVEALEVREELTLKEVAELVRIKTVQPLIKRLIEKKRVAVSEEIHSRYSPKYLAFVEISEYIRTAEKLGNVLNELEANKRNEKQVNALLKIIDRVSWNEGTQNPVPKREILDDEITESQLKSLEKKGFITIYNAEVTRLSAKKNASKEIPDLSPAQQQAHNEIQHLFTEKDIVLLHGITSSGKTEIYVRLIQEQLEQGKQVLFLLPEIALTTQLISRLQHYFGDLVGVYHSRFNQNERTEIWYEILKNSGKFRIILGARSALFLPFSNLGLIIVDEEHETSFKQHDPSPRYHARDTAVVLGQLHQAKILLGSATPSIETYYNATENRYGLVTLTERFGGVKPPEIQCADLEKETRQKTMKSHFSSFLIEEMEKALAAKEQIILFQNRRGYAPIWSCELCGWNPMCKNCDVSLTYHKAGNTLKCHYCGYFISPPSSCGACGSNKLKMLGFGTEKIEDELSLMFPKIRIQRMDLDSTRAKNAYQTIITDFENRNVDVLVGTQMITKGLDFDNVGLVGILSADKMLHYPDFRSFERSYQLMSQVAGRAGRKQKRGKVVIQTYDPHHWIIGKVMQHDYEGLYAQEIIERKNFGWPPFFRLIQVRLKHKNADTLEMGAATLGKELRNVFNERVLGPESPAVSRVKNFYLKNITIKFERTASPKKVKDALQEKINLVLNTHDFRSIITDIDVDPA
jgi:primosomal protein N' (replication factor Y) (superfamily II helicase)